MKRYQSSGFRPHTSNRGTDARNIPDRAEQGSQYSLLILPTAALSAKAVTSVMKEPKLWLCLYDIHFPQYDQKTFRAILSFIRKSEVRGLLLGGDALDLSCVSHWGNKDLPGNRRKGELKADLDGFDKQIIQPLEALLPRGCEKVFLTGNPRKDAGSKSDRVDARTGRDDRLQAIPAAY